MFKIVSFGICPFVQRSLITMNYKKVPYEVDYIDLANKPDWFVKLSPTGKVPVLKVENDVLFESSVINEYIDEVTEGSLLPKQPLERAKARAYIDFSSAIIMSYFTTAIAKDEEAYLKCKQDLESKLTVFLSSYVGPFFSGDEFSLVDSATIPALQRIFITKNLYSDLNISEEAKKKFMSWLDAGNRLEEVKNSVPVGFIEDFQAYLVKRESFIHLRA